MYMKQKEAAKFLGMSVNTFKDRVRPYVQHKQVGRCLFFSVKELRRFMENGFEEELKVKRVLQRLD